MPVLAFTTFAIMKAPYGNPIVKGFEDLTPSTFAAAEQSPGFIERATEQGEPAPHLSNFEQNWGKWGKFAVPRFYDGGYSIATDTRACTLSLWRDIDSVHTFVYRSSTATRWPSAQNGFARRNGQPMPCGGSRITQFRPGTRRRRGWSTSMTTVRLRSPLIFTDVLLRPSAHWN